MITLAVLFYILISLIISYEFTKDGYTEYGFQEGYGWSKALFYGFSFPILVILVLAIFLLCVLALLRVIVWIGTNMP